MQNVIALEQYFGMSHLAMLWRLVSEGYLSQEKLDDYNYGVISAARTLGYDDKLYNPTPIEFQSRTYNVMEPYANQDKVSIFKELQLFESVGLIEPVGTDHMYFAAMESRSCRLTALGLHYWKLSRERMLSGRAPIGWDGYSVRLHHWQGIAIDFFDYSPVSRTLHTLIHYGHV